MADERNARAGAALAEGLEELEGSRGGNRSEIVADILARNIDILVLYYNYAGIVVRLDVDGRLPRRA